MVVVRIRSLVGARGGLALPLILPPSPGAPSLPPRLIASALVLPTPVVLSFVPLPLAVLFVLAPLLPSLPLGVSPPSAASRPPGLPPVLASRLSPPMGLLARVLPHLLLPVRGHSPATLLPALPGVSLASSRLL